MEPKKKFLMEKVTRWVKEKKIFYFYFFISSNRNTELNVFNDSICYSIAPPQKADIIKLCW